MAREVILALPHELPAVTRASLTRDMGLWLVERYGVAVDISLHSPEAGDGHDPRNHHAHLLFTTREVTKDGLGKKTRILDDRENGPQEVELIRLIWETLANDALEQAGFPEAKIDRRTLDAQGIDRIPTIHIGPEGKAAEDRRSQESDDSDRADDGEEDGEAGSAGGGQGGSGGNGVPPPPTAAKEKDPAVSSSKNREVDYAAIDNGQSRSELVDEIKRVNAARSQWPDEPLAVQIEAIEKEMAKLDRKVRHFEDLYVKTSLPSAIKKSIVEIVRFSKELLFTRILNREAVRLSGEEIQARVMRQNFRYGRSYRTGIHTQIQTMKQRLHILEESHHSYRRYKSFVDTIEKAILGRPVMAFPENLQSKEITNQEVALKIKLKAELIREGVPVEFRPSKEAAPIKTMMNREPESSAVAKELERKPPANPLKEGLSNLPLSPLDAAPIVSRERKDWYLPATEKTQPFRESVERILAVQNQDRPPAPIMENASIFGQSFNRASAGEKPEKRATNEDVIYKTSVLAEKLRQNVPPEYRKEQNSKDGSQGVRMASAFNSAAARDNKEASPSRESGYTP